MCAAAPPQHAGVGRTERCPGSWWPLFSPLFFRIAKRKKKKRKIRILNMIILPLLDLLSQKLSLPVRGFALGGRRSGEALTRLENRAREKFGGSGARRWPRCRRASRGLWAMDAQQLRRELKSWRQSFVHENGGRQPTKVEIKAIGLPFARATSLATPSSSRLPPLTYPPPALGCCREAPG